LISAAYAYTKREKTETKDAEIFKLFWKMMLAAGIIMIVAVFVCANKGIHSELWEPYRNILIFSDRWGTGRGLNWRLGMDYWRNDSTFLSKIIGYGPDTYYIITMDRFMNIMEDAGYGMFDSAHNEYFEYFITVGVLGLASYIALLFTAIRKMLRSGVSGIRAAAIGVIAYAFQAVVNIAIPITTPVFMILMFMGCGKKSENEG
jgi:O-antigen ligase